ncbi:MAG: phage Gp37/Gp68 family protein [Nitrososphaeraceae archaeon]|nr:phage Gp37/Gp68 family protein [Nitrososphaeraceae archaeon]
MGNNSSIEWTNCTWNVITGCDKVSPGCKNCYAERVATRLQKMRVKKYSNGFELRIHPDVLNYPQKLKESKMIFVNSMSDLFHEKLGFDFIVEIFNVMEKANWHKYQVLTKRSIRLKEFARYYGKFPDNVWIGVSVENALYKKRIDDLKTVKSKIHFLSLEPLLGSVGKMNLDDIEWVIAGGESGPNFRECNIEWLREIRDQCLRERIPFFFKQWGGLTPKSGGNILDGKTWEEFPRIKDKIILKTK